MFVLFKEIYALMSQENLACKFFPFTYSCLVALVHSKFDISIHVNKIVEILVTSAISYIKFTS